MRPLVFKKGPANQKPKFSMTKASLHGALAAFPRAGRRHWLSASADIAFGGRFRGFAGARCTCGLPHDVNPISIERPVYFVFRPGTSSWGSVRLRVFQLAGALRLAVNQPKRIRVVSESQFLRLRIQDADVVASKYLLGSEVPGWLISARRRGNRVFADVVDGFPTPGLDEHVDAFLCASKSEFEFRSASGVSAVQILHQVDSRFDPQDFVRTEFRLGYLGTPGGAIYTELLPALEKQYTKLSMTRFEAYNLSKQVKLWSHHYSVRAFFGEGVFKPATKAFLAARFGAIFIGSRDDLESKLVLGADYPYLAQSSTRDDILSVTALAQETFGGTVWHRAQVVMNNLRRETCDFQIGLDFATFLRQDFA